VAFWAIVVTAATEPMIPALLKPLLDQGFTAAQLPLWMVPVAIIGLFACAGLAGFVAQYGLAWAANRGVLTCARHVRAPAGRPAGLFPPDRQQLTNTLVYEVQTGASAAGRRAADLVRDSLTLLALLGYLMWLNWKLTLFVAPAVPGGGAGDAHLLSAAAPLLTPKGQQATDELAYVVEENVLAWRIVRLHGAGRRRPGASSATRRAAPADAEGRGRRRHHDAADAVAGRLALSAVITVALWQAGSGGSVGGRLRGLHHRHADAGGAGQAPVGRDGAHHPRPGRHGARPGPDRHQPGRGRRQPCHPAGARGEIGAATDVACATATTAPGAGRADAAVRAGETVALVGPSGAGKTTLVNLLPRFVDPPRRICWTACRWPTGTCDALRRQFALVSQDVVLFNDSVAANVALGADVDPARVRAALRRPTCWTSSTACRRAWTPHRPQRQPAVGRPAPAPGHRPRAVQGRADPDPGRSHLGAGRRSERAVQDALDG
jgi:subfamily B ATP-binding cassette protein MsbA